MKEIKLHFRSPTVIPSSWQLRK